MKKINKNMCFNAREICNTFYHFFAVIYLEEFLAGGK